DGKLTTGFIAEEYPDGFTGAPAAPELIRTLAAIAAFAATAEADRARRIDGQLGRRLQPPADWAVRIGDVDHAVSVSADSIAVDGEDVPLAMEYTPGDRMIEVEPVHPELVEGREPLDASLVEGGPSTGSGRTEEGEALTVR